MARAELDPKALDGFKKRFDEAKNARARYEPDFFVNLAFLSGSQWVFWNRSRLDKIPNPDGKRVMIVDNRIRGVVDTRIARQTKSRPGYLATPFTLDESDVESARLAEKICEADYVELDLQRKLYAALLWKETCGAGFWKVYWDKTKGESETFVIDPRTNQPLVDGFGRPVKKDALVQQYGQDVLAQFKTEQLAQGAVCIDPISPFEFYPSPLATSMEDCEWAVECKVRSLEYVKARWQVDLAGDADAQPGIAESRLLGAIGSDGPIPQGSPSKKQGVKVYEYWCRPESKYPNGCRVVWAKDQILEADDGPFDPMPYVMFSGQRIPGRFWPAAIISQLRGPQSDLNKLESQVQESAERIGNPSLLWNKFFGTDNIPKGLPGETVFYDGTVPGSKPEYLQPAEVPVYVQNQIERIEHSIQEISGLHEVSKATVPAGVTAASAINLLQEADDTRLGPEVADAETALAHAGTKSLKLYAAFASDGRLVRIAGEEGDWDVFEFRGNMLRNNTNVEVQGGSMMPRSKAAKMAAMTEVFGLALQYGVPLEPRNVRSFFKDYEVGGIDKLFANIAPAESQIVWENRMLSRGNPVPINSYDDDDLHIQGHEDFQNSARYRGLDPQLKALVEQHVQLHRQRRVQTANAAVQQQQQEQAAAANQQLQFELHKLNARSTAQGIIAGQNGGQ